jgi:hypothetical protein
MLLNINRAKKLHLVGEIENDENKEYIIQIVVSPIKRDKPAEDGGDEIQTVGVADGTATIIQK